MPKLKVELDADGSKLARGLQGAGNSIKNWAGSVKGVIAGALSIGAVKSLLDSTVSTFDTLGNQAKQADIAVDKMASLARIMRDTKGETEGLKMALGDLRQAQIEALKEPSSNAGKFFSGIGISQAQLNATPQSDQLLGLVMDRMQGKNLVQMQNSLEGIFSKKSIPDLFAAKDDLTTAGQNRNYALNKRAGRIPTPEQVDKLKEAQDNYADSQMQMQVVLSDLAVVMLKVQTAITGLVTWLSKQFKDKNDNIDWDKVWADAISGGTAGAIGGSLGLLGVGTLVGAVGGALITGGTSYLQQYGKETPESPVKLPTKKITPTTKASVYTPAEIATLRAEQLKAAEKERAKTLLPNVEQDLEQRKTSLESLRKKQGIGVFEASSEIARGNFAGVNMSLLQSSGQQQIDILKSIDKTNKEMLQLEKLKSQLQNQAGITVQP